MHFASITLLPIHFVSVYNFNGDFEYRRSYLCDGIYDVNPGYFQFVEQQLWQFTLSVFPHERQELAKIA